MIILKSRPHLAATPDFILSCDCHGDVPVEIKCPFTMKNSHSLIIDMAKMLNVFVCAKNGELTLRENHEYYYQVQLQILLMNSTFGYFVVWSPYDLWFIEITRNETFLHSRLLKAEIFFLNVILPEMLGNFFTKSRCRLSDLQTNDLFRDSQKDTYYNSSLLYRV